MVYTFRAGSTVGSERRTPEVGKLTTILVVTDARPDGSGAYSPMSPPSATAARPVRHAQFPRVLQTCQSANVNPESDPEEWQPIRSLCVLLQRRKGTISTAGLGWDDISLLHTQRRTPTQGKPYLGFLVGSG